jgi:hypothetical protein
MLLSVALYNKIDSEFKGSTSNTYECGENLIFRWHLATTLEQEDQEPSNPFLIPNNLLDIPPVVSIHTHKLPSRPNSQNQSLSTSPKKIKPAPYLIVQTHIIFSKKKRSYPSDPCNHPKKTMTRKKITPNGGMKKTDEPALQERLIG